jgi:hypothetical protein
MGTILLLLVTGVLVFAYGIFLFFKRKPIRAGLSGLLATPMILAGGLFGMLLLNVQTYKQLTHEVILAEISIGKMTPTGVSIRLKSDSLDKEFLIRSDQWRLDARFLKWKPWMSMLGKEPLVRLERLEERGITGNMDQPINQYDLVAGKQWLDAITSALSQNMGLIDSVYGSSVYMPVRPGASYQVSATVSGLIARPANPEAKAAVIEWSNQ